MIASFTVILFCQLLGEVVARGLGVPVPGPVVGMVFMLMALALRDSLGGAADRETDGPAAYVRADRVSRLTGRHTAVNPVVLSVAVIAVWILAPTTMPDRRGLR